MCNKAQPRATVWKILSVKLCKLIVEHFSFNSLTPPPLRSGFPSPNGRGARGEGKIDKLFF